MNVNIFLISFGQPHAKFYLVSHLKNKIFSFFQLIMYFKTEVV